MAIVQERNRMCDNCHEPYHRRNVVETWSSQNPGHRDGWRKTTRRICLHCQGQSQSQRLITLASITVVPRPRGRKRRRQQQERTAA